VLVVLGQRGSGKSTLVNRIIRRSNRVVVLDTLAEHYAAARPVALAELRGYLEQPTYRVSVVPQDYSEFETACDGVALRRSFVYVVDELDFWVANAAGHDTPRGLLEMVRYGRHRDQRLVLVARRPAAVPRELTSQAALAVFRSREPRDAEYLRAFGAGDLDLGALNIGEYYLIDETVRRYTNR